MSESIEIPVLNAAGKKAGTLSVSAAIVAEKRAPGLLHEVVRGQRAAKRSGTHKTKTRTEVSGGGVKPWKQKGTGRARAGSIRSPLWVGGGIAHGPKPRDYSFQINKKEKKKALRSAISARRGEEKLFVIADLELTSIKTKQALAVLDNVGIIRGESTLIVLPAADEQAEKSLRNIAGIKAIRAEGLNVYDILSRKNLVFIGDALQAVAARLEA